MRFGDDRDVFQCTALKLTDKIFARDLHMPHGAYYDDVQNVQDIRVSGINPKNNYIVTSNHSPFCIFIATLVGGITSSFARAENANC